MARVAIVLSRRWSRLCGRRGLSSQAPLDLELQSYFVPSKDKKHKLHLKRVSWVHLPINQLKLKAYRLLPSDPAAWSGGRLATCVSLLPWSDREWAHILFEEQQVSVPGPKIFIKLA